MEADSAPQVHGTVDLTQNALKRYIISAPADADVVTRVVQAAGVEVPLMGSHCGAYAQQLEGREEKLGKLADGVEIVAPHKSVYQELRDDLAGLPLFAGWEAVLNVWKKHGCPSWDFIKYMEPGVPLQQLAWVIAHQCQQGAGLADISGSKAAAVNCGCLDGLGVSPGAFAYANVIPASNGDCYAWDQQQRRTAGRVVGSASPAGAEPSSDALEVARLNIECCLLAGRACGCLPNTLVLAGSQAVLVMCGQRPSHGQLYGREEAPPLLPRFKDLLLEGVVVIIMPYFNVVIAEPYLGEQHMLDFLAEGGQPLQGTCELEGQTRAFAASRTLQRICSVYASALGLNLQPTQLVEVYERALDAILHEASHRFGDPCKSLLCFAVRGGCAPDLAQQLQEHSKALAVAVILSREWYARSLRHLAVVVEGERPGTNSLVERFVRDEVEAQAADERQRTEEWAGSWEVAEELSEEEATVAYAAGRVRAVEASRKVVFADGSTRPLSQVRVGDKLMSGVPDEFGNPIVLTVQKVTRYTAIRPPRILQTYHDYRDREALTPKLSDWGLDVCCTGAVGIFIKNHDGVVRMVSVADASDRRGDYGLRVHLASHWVFPEFDEYGMPYPRCAYGLTSQTPLLDLLIRIRGMVYEAALHVLPASSSFWGRLPSPDSLRWRVSERALNLLVGGQLSDGCNNAPEASIGWDDLELLPHFAQLADAMGLVLAAFEVYEESNLKVRFTTSSGPRKCPRARVIDQWGKITDEQPYHDDRQLNLLYQFLVAVGYTSGGQDERSLFPWMVDVITAQPLPEVCDCLAGLVEGDGCRVDLEGKSSYSFSQGSNCGHELMVELAQRCAVRKGMGGLTHTGPHRHVVIMRGAEIGALSDAIRLTRKQLPAGECPTHTVEPNSRTIEVQQAEGRVRCVALQFSSSCMGCFGDVLCPDGLVLRMGSA